MENKQLQQWIEHISLTSFGVPFKHIASFNSRLRTTGGRYFTKSHNIEISSLQLELHGTEEVEKIIKHELCHYHLHLARRGYQHRDADFKQLLKQVGGTRFCSALPIPKRKEPYRYKLLCTSCEMEYLRKRKVNPSKYACGKCRGKLKLFQIVLVKQVT
ncbi:SprT family protein [Paenibacillus psychroresistens]|uniref:SprT family protein n=1 Tax=Paenibacillus psychroresistens TaxID=1778678 RepID=A0A6B8RTA2_9BACL|nr:SprT family protein [Paenibacillus psychroresistens]QGQ98438.1 SprT family protein [Paenibacillus psychroresistens]